MRVLILGAGYAGALAAVRLAGRARERVDITVVNPRPGFVHRLRMHHVAVGYDVPSRSLVELLGSGIRFVEGSVAALDPDRSTAEIAGPEGLRTIRFDRVIIATGSTTESAPVPGGENAYGLADIDSARKLRAAFAALAPEAEVAVVGGGFTGLETVAEMAERRPDIRVRLIARGDVAEWFSPRARSHVRETLAGLGVETIGGARVAAVQPRAVLLDDGAEISADLTVWCGGFAAAPLAREAGLTVDEQGAVVTDAALRSVSHPTVLAVGDAAHAPSPQGGRYSMSCQFALPSGAHAADVLRNEAFGRSEADRDAYDQGFLARCLSLGSRAAVVQLTDRDDVATERAILGRSAVLAKRLQLGGMLPAIASERRMPGLVRWPGSGREGTRAMAPVAG